MTDPLSRSAREMLERAVADERLLTADDARRARLKRALLSGVAASGTGLLGSSASQAAMGAKASSGVAPLLPLVKGLAGGLLLSGMVAGSWHLVAPARSRPPPPLSRSNRSAVVERAELPAVAAQAAPASSVASVLSGAPPKARVAVATAVAAPSEPSATPGSTLRAELELMSQVQTALRDNRGVRALSLLERYDDAFPRGQLGTERLAAEVFAACQVGDVARARRAATKFLQRDASSTLAERVKAACIDSERAR
jgi:hypothetical protein